MELSVIIPTYNRADALNNCLKHLSKQTITPDKFEIIIVNDGGTDNTDNIVKKWQQSLKNISYYKQKNAGAGAARNKAINHAKGEITLLIGDDIYASPKLLEEHLKTHNTENQAVLGHINWWPEIEVTTLMKWLTNEINFFGKLTGPQFNFKKLKKHPANFYHFYTSNISLPTKLLTKEKFDLDFKNYGWEDIELGYRLHKNHQLKIIYNPKAITYHDHYINTENLKKRMYGIGKNAKIMNKKHPELKITPSAYKKIIFKIISKNLFLNTTQKLAKLNDKFAAIYFYALSKKYFMEGLEAK